MAHSIRKILYCTSEGKKHLFAIVTRDAHEDEEKVFTHVFVTAKKDQVGGAGWEVTWVWPYHYQNNQPLVNLSSASPAPVAY